MHDLHKSLLFALFPRLASHFVPWRAGVDEISLVIQHPKRDRAGFHDASVTFIALAKNPSSALALGNIHACHGDADYFPGLVEGRLIGDQDCHRVTFARGSGPLNLKAGYL